jgi:nucleoside diphosphate kinase
MGPEDVEVAAREASGTLRGRFGSSNIANAVHGSANAEAANAEVRRAPRCVCVSVC